MNGFRRRNITNIIKDSQYKGVRTSMVAGQVCFAAADTLQTVEGYLRRAGGRLMFGKHQASVHEFAAAFNARYGVDGVFWRQPTSAAHFWSKIP